MPRTPAALIILLSLPMLSLLATTVAASAGQTTQSTALPAYLHAAATQGGTAAAWIIRLEQPGTPDDLPAAWHAPALTPAMAAVLQRQQQEKLAREMAERAFYFGYDANDDALK